MSTPCLSQDSPRRPRPARHALACCALAVTLLAALMAPASAQQPPGEVTGLTATSDTRGELVVSWDAPSPLPTDFRVDWAKEGESYASWRVEERHLYPGGDVGEVTISGLEPGASYKVRVRARYYRAVHQARPWSGPWAELDEAVTVAQTTVDPHAPQTQQSQPDTTEPEETEPEETESEETESEETEPEETESEETESEETEPEETEPEETESEETEPEETEPGLITGLAVSSPSPGTLSVSWDRPDPAPSDYRVVWHPVGTPQPSWRDQNANAYRASELFTITGLDEDVDYRVLVRARYLPPRHQPSWSGPFAAATGHVSYGVPAAPTGLTVSRVTHQRATLAWTAPKHSKVTGYHVQRSTDDASASVSLGSTWRSFTDLGLAPETTYRYVVTALNDLGAGVESRPVEVTTTAPAVDPGLPVPAAVTASLDGNGGVRLDWDEPRGDNAADITGYRILRGATAETLEALVRDTASTDTAWVDTDTAAGATWVYAVRARTTHTMSAPSTAVTVDVIGAPTGLVAYRMINGVGLSWNTHSGDETVTGYQILRGTDAGSLAVLVDDTASTLNYYLDTAAEPGTTYVYSLRARNSHGLGPAAPTIGIFEGGPPTTQPTEQNNDDTHDTQTQPQSQSQPRTQRPDPLGGTFTLPTYRRADSPQGGIATYGMSSTKNTPAEFGDPPQTQRRNTNTPNTRNAITARQANTASTGTGLVSNLNQPDIRSHVQPLGYLGSGVNVRDQAAAVSFTTGRLTTGYDVEGVTLDLIGLASPVGLTVEGTLKVAVHDDDSGTPGDAVTGGTFPTKDYPASGGLVTLQATKPISLAASTTYWLVIELDDHVPTRSGGGVRTTPSTSEDPCDGGGFSLGNYAYRRGVANSAGWRVSSIHSNEAIGRGIPKVAILGQITGYAGSTTSTVHEPFCGDLPANSSTMGKVSPDEGPAIGRLTGLLDTGRFDTDWFQVDLAAGVDYEIKVETLLPGRFSTSYDLGIWEVKDGKDAMVQTAWGQRLWRASGGRILGSVEPGIMNRTPFRPADAGTYYVSISTPLNSHSPGEVYGLTVTSDDAAQDDSTALELDASSGAGPWSVDNYLMVKSGGLPDPSCAGITDYNDHSDRRACSDDRPLEDPDVDWIELTLLWETDYQIAYGTSSCTQQPTINNIFDHAGTAVATSNSSPSCFFHRLNFNTGARPSTSVGTATTGTFYAEVTAQGATLGRGSGNQPRFTWSFFGTQGELTVTKLG